MKSKKLLLLVSLLFAGTTIKPAIVSFDGISTENQVYLGVGVTTGVAATLAIQYACNGIGSVVDKATKKANRLVDDYLGYALVAGGATVLTWLMLQKK
jgi:hypothetical protein